MEGHQKEHAARAHAMKVPLAVTHAEMRRALDNRFAVPFGPGMLVGIARYDNAWWVAWEGGWLRVTDELTAADLDAVAARLAKAEVASGSEKPADALRESGGPPDMGESR